MNINIDTSIYVEITVNYIRYGMYLKINFRKGKKQFYSIYTKDS